MIYGFERWLLQVPRQVVMVAWTRVRTMEIGENEPPHAETVQKEKTSCRRKANC